MEYQATRLLRERLAEKGVLSAEQLRSIEPMLDELDRQLEFQLGQRSRLNGRINWLEGQLRGGHQQSVLSALEGVLKAGSEALMRARHAELDKIRARVMLDDAMLAVTIDSLAAMRDRLADEGTPAPNVQQALDAFMRMTRPETTATEVEVSAG